MHQRLPLRAGADDRGRHDTIAGGGSTGLGDGGPATSAGLQRPGAVTVDSSGDLLIADAGSNQLRMVAPASCAAGCAYGLAGADRRRYLHDRGERLARLLRRTAALPPALELDATLEAVALDRNGDLVIADTDNNCVRVVAAASCDGDRPYDLAAMTAGDIYTVAGDGVPGFSGDGGAAASAELYNQPASQSTPSETC